MKARCTNPKCYEFKSYGGKGVCVCEAWQKFEQFYEWATNNGYEDDLSIDRIDAQGNYEPPNCRWIKMKDQSLNRTDNHIVTAFGRSQTIKEWSTETGIKYDTIERRINAYGWTAEDAVSIKPQHGRKYSSKSR